MGMTAAVVSAGAAFALVAITLIVQSVRLGKFIGRTEGMERDVLARIAGVQDSIEDLKVNHLAHLAKNVGRLFELFDERGQSCAERGERLAKVEQRLENGMQRLDRLDRAIDTG